MQSDIEDRIRNRAFEMWQDEGCPAGRDLDFWLKAESELLQEPIKAAKALAAKAKKAAPKTAPKAPRKSRAA
jgi:hypothetical protein